jgi:acetyl-CoA carboxylase carboxyl transferase subunit alpha
MQVRQVAEENGVDVSEQIKELEDRAIGLRQDTYERLSPVQRLQVARHPSRPTFLDIAYNICDKFVELHGDRGGLDDAAIVCGLASIDGISFMLIGQQKGRNTKENILRNFAMPQPNGYRKALRFMKFASPAKHVMQQLKVFFCFFSKQLVILQCHETVYKMNERELALI